MGFTDCLHLLVYFSDTMSFILVMLSVYVPVSSIYIWSENLVAESEAKDGGN